MDDLRIYTRALSASEVYSLASGGGTTTPLSPMKTISIQSAQATPDAVNRSVAIQYETSGTASAVAQSDVSHKAMLESPEDVDDGPDTMQPIIRIEYSIAGMNSWLPIPEHELETFGNRAIWRLADKFNTGARYDIRVCAVVNSVVQSSAIASDVDLTKLFGKQVDCAKACALNNPYRGEGSIVFANLAPETSITIYTLSGKRVATLAATSEGQAVWNVRRSDGRALAPGTHLARIRSASGMKTITLVIQR
jgi:hypothetical protein